MPLLAVTATLVGLASVAAESVAAICLTEPATRIDCYPPVAHFPNVTEEACFAQGCCWKPLDNNGVPCAFDARGKPDDAQCALVPAASRLECRNPRYFAALNGDRQTCHDVGCCFDDDSGMCYQPFVSGYELLTLDELDDGWRGTLVLKRFARGPFGNDVPLLQLRVMRETEHRVRVRITDPAFARFEVPDVVVAPSAESHDTPPVRDDRSAYRVHFTESPFGIAVTHRASGDVLFNSTPPTERGTAFNGLVFANQFLELSTQLSDRSASDGDDSNRNGGNGDGKSGDGDDDGNARDSAPVLFGLGERVAPLQLRADSHGDHYPLFARDQDADTPHDRDGGDNLAGVHPFWMQLRSSGAAHGVFLLSSNAMEVVTQRNALTYRTTGGVLDLFVFAGPTPMDVVAQYTALVGRPALPPYWALGYHVGVTGAASSLDDSVALVARMREQGVPLEALWLDVDYMDQQQTFTLDEARFPRAALQQFVDELHFHNQYLVAIQTPAISITTRRGDDSDTDGSQLSETRSAKTNTTLERGQALGVLVRGVEGEPVAQKFVGATWSAFVDFFHPNASAFWTEQLAALHDSLLPFDGLWLDKTEPSSACDLAFAADANACPADVMRVSSTTRSHERSRHRRRDNGDGDDDDGDSDDDDTQEITFTSALAADPSADSDSAGGFVRSSDVAFPFDPYRQPFAPGQSSQTRGGHGNLNSRTLPMAALHHTSLHYNVHSLYGHAAARATRAALDTVLQKRSVLLARSTFAGSGQYVGHWLSNSAATWTNLRLSIAGVLQMNLLGMPLVGPTLCSPVNVTMAELCVRWHQAVSFSPLMRQHTSVSSSSSTELGGTESVNLIRGTLLRRYRYLPYLYTQLFVAHTAGVPVVRPLVFEFPADRVAKTVEHQYLVGSALMVSPVVDEGAIAKRVYFPNAAWYDARTGKQLIDSRTNDRDSNSNSDDNARASRTIKLLTPLDDLQVHVRGGAVVPTQEPATTTTLSRRGAFTLVVALDTAHERPHASGELFVDDGDSLGSVADARYSRLAFGAFQNASDRFDFKTVVTNHDYDGPEMHVPLRAIKVYGLAQSFHANSSLRATLSFPASDRGGDRDGDDQEVRAEYFANAKTLVLSDLNVPIGQALHLRVVAHPGKPDHVPSDAKDARAGHDSDDKERGSASGSGGDGEHAGAGESNSPPKRKQRYSTLAIIGAVVGVLFLLGICAICVLQRRRGASGYDPIA